MAKKASRRAARKARKAPPGTTTPVDDPTAPKTPGKGAWRVMDKGSSLVAGMLAHRASTIAWRVVTGKKAPAAGQHPEVSVGEAVAWAAIGGAIVELVKVGVSRGAASYWVRSTGNLPPGMKPLGDRPGTAKEPVPQEPAPSRTSTRKVSRRSRGR